MDKLTQLLRKRKTSGGSVSRIYYGKELDKIPVVPVAPWTSEVLATCTGPNAGLTQLDLFAESRSSAVIAGSTNWNSPTEYAYGCATSLYEEDKTRHARELPTQTITVEDTGRAHSPVLYGEPVADVFGIQVRENSAILALADGVGWGYKSRLSARCAVHGVMEYIQSNLSQIQQKPDSHTITQLLLHAVTSKAQQLIIENQATLTTLSAAVVCEMGTKPDEWGLFVVAVGDSPVYVYCPHTKNLSEVTVGCHAHTGERLVTMAGGTLGPAHGSQPDLENLTIAYMPVYPGDIVFCTSDGVSDNFSPRVSSKASTFSSRICVGKQTVSKLKPCCQNTVYMNEVLCKLQDELHHNFSAQTVVSRLLNHVFEATENKRQFRLECYEKNIDIRRKAKDDPQFACIVESITGKLDHATVVAYQVGHH